MKLILLVLVAVVGHAQTFEELSKLYRYDPGAPLNVVTKEMEGHGGGYKLFQLQFALPKGQTKSGFLVVPVGAGRKPGVVWMHSSGALEMLGDAVLLAKMGAVSLLVDPEGVVESAEQSRDRMISDVVALRRAADVLQARNDVDASRLALAGHSYGSMMCATAVSVDERFRAAVFEVGLLGMSIHIATSPHPWAESIRKGLGADLPQWLKVISVVDAKHYIGHAPSIPKMFQSAWYDPGVPRKDAEDFYNAATGPKVLKWYDTGHDIDDIAALADRARFLGKALSLRDTEHVAA